MRNPVPTAEFAIFFRRRMKSEVLPGPGALRFVEDDDVIVGCGLRCGCLVSEVVDVLDEWLHLLADRAFPLSVAGRAQFVAGQRLLEDGDQWAVPREEDRSRLANSRLRVATFKTDECLPGTRYARDEHDRFLASLASERSMISSTPTEVTRRFFAPASCARSRPPSDGHRARAPLR